MSSLDPRSVIVISSLMAVVSLIILISLRRNAAASIRGISEWIAAFLAVIVAAGLLISRENLHPVWGAVVANTLMVLAVMLFDLGLRRFYGDQASLKPLVLAGGVLFAGLAFVTFVSYSYRVRLTLVTGSLLCAYAFALWHLLRHASGTFGERITQLSFAVPAVGVSLRLLTVGDIDQESQLFRPSMVQSFYLTSLGAGVLSAGVGFILMVNERTRTELEKLARGLEQTTQELLHRNEIKTRFLAYAGHDLRQPLQAVHLLLASLMESGLDRQQDRTARMIESSVNALTDLLDSLLDISKLDAGVVKPNPRPFDVDVLLVQLVQEFMPQAHARGLRLKLWLPAGELAVVTDEQLLSSVLRNLIGNAIKYTWTGGVLVAARRVGDGLKLQVLDTGIGISDEDSKHIFEEYFQVDNPQRDRNQGLGLGLSIVSRISALLDLKISCRSRVGKGTVMQIVLPLATGRPAARETPHKPVDLAGLAGVRVVVVEDSMDVAAALVAWLQSQGARVTRYISAEEALAAPSILAADIYLSDYRLAGSLSGLDFLNALRSRTAKEIPAALLTGDTSSQFIETASASGWPILFKPVNPRELKAVLKLLLQAQRDLH